MSPLYDFSDRARCPHCDAERVLAETTEVEYLPIGDYLYLSRFAYRLSPDEIVEYEHIVLQTCQRHGHSWPWYSADHLLIPVPPLPPDF